VPILFDLNILIIFGKDFKLQLEPTAAYPQQYGAQWKQHTERMAGKRWTKLITYYKPPGKSSLGRPRKH
jgi:hypothetical protein